MNVIHVHSTEKRKPPSARQALTASAKAADEMKIVNRKREIVYFLASLKYTIVVPFFNDNRF